MKLSHIITASVLPVLALLLVIAFWYTYDEKKQLVLTSQEREVLTRQSCEQQEGIAYHVVGR